MKAIPIRGIKGQGLYAFVDDDDFDFVNRFKWHLSRKGYAEARVPAKMKKQYPVSGIQMQRLLMFNQVDKSKIVDHINHIKLDNRKSNLRVCTMAESNMNRGKIYFKRQQAKVSRYKGVSWGKCKWRSCITVNNKRYYLGFFDTEEDAALAYNRAAILFHGKYAYLNEVSKEAAV